MLMKFYFQRHQIFTEDSQTTITWLRPNWMAADLNTYPKLIAEQNVLC